MSKATILTDDNFNNDRAGISVIDFYAAWCGPCKPMGQLMDLLAEENLGKVMIAKVDVDTNPKLSTQFMIKSLPTIVFIKDGQQIDKHVGFLSADKIRNKIAELLK